MKFYSEMLNKMYDTQEALESAEKVETSRLEAKRMAESKRSEMRAADAKRVEEKRNAAHAAAKEYSDELNAFVKKYGYYHSSVDENAAVDLGDFITGLFSKWF